MDKKTVGERIQTVRGKLSREAFADKLDVSPLTINRYEKGERSPSADFLVDVVRIFRLDPGWLLTGKSPVPLNIDSASAPDELICTGQLLKILRGRNQANVTAIKTNLHAFALTSDIEVPDGDDGDKQAQYYPSGAEEPTTTYDAAEEEAPYNNKKNNHS